VPWHPYSETTQQPVAAGEVVEIVLDLRPTSYRWPTGHRIRVTVAGADAGQVVLPHDAASSLHIRRGGAYRSRIMLPVVDGSLPLGV
jgi:predicted acyl esterase